MAENATVLGAWRDEKAYIALGDEGIADRRCDRAKHRDWCRAISLVLILVLLGLGSLRFFSRSIVWQPMNMNCGEAQDKLRMVDDFKQITPSNKLEWHPCFYYYQCARLTVPMDYNRPLDVSGARAPKVHLALLMVPGRNHTTTGKYSISPLLLNPGGPSGSGIDFATSAGFQLQEIVGEDQDIIGFDPRGVGQTTPLVDCWAFPEDESLKDGEDDVSPADISRGWIHRLAWLLTGWEMPLVNSTVESLGRLDTRSRLEGNLCATKAELHGKDSILRHVSTSAVARDMLSIVDAWDAWREKQENFEDDQDSIMTKSPTKGVENSRLDTKGKLVYWGFSYGTLLGATFAAMFPDRVGRVILDGVLNADSYVSPIWTESLTDTDAVEASFFKYCHKAGTRCAIFRDGDSEADIRARVYNIIHKLKNNPVHGISPETHTPTILTYEFLKSLMFSSLYFPIISFPAAALILDFFYREDVAFLIRVFQLPASYDFKPYCAGYVPPQYQHGDIQKAIMCSDKRYPLNDTISDLQTRFEKLANISSYGDVWMTIMIGCSGWSVKATDPPMRWDEHPSHRQKPIKTSFPLLFISNTADPVTPLRSGVKMARKFVDAGLIEQLSEGHCSLAAKSLCTVSKLREYLFEGKVPAAPEWGPEGREVEEGKWERCESNEWPWMPPDSVADGASEVDLTEEARMMKAWGKVGEAASRMKFWGMRDIGIQVDWDMLRELEELRVASLK